LSWFLLVRLFAVAAAPGPGSPAIRDDVDVDADDPADDDDCCWRARRAGDTSRVMGFPAAPCTWPPLAAAG
jgi:hypothetical protein